LNGRKKSSCPTPNDNYFFLFHSILFIKNLD